MKKITVIISLIVILAIGISGCGSSSSTQSSTQPSAQPDNQQSSTAPSATGGQRQFSRPDLSGEVTSVTGNQIVLKVIEMPAPRQNNGQGNNNQGNKSQGNNNPGNNGQQRQRGQGQNGNPSQQRNLKYTGESKTITIPDGTSITTFVRDNNGRETKNVELKDIKQGDILQVWYSDKDKGTISRITLMTRQAGNTAGNTSNGQSGNTSNNGSGSTSGT